MNDILFGNNNTKTIKRLSKQYFKKNKVRNLAAILAIVLTAFLFTSITSLAFNMVSSMQLSMQMQKGSKGDGTFGYMTEEQFEQLKNSDFVEQAGHRRTIGYASNAVGHSVELNYADSIQQELTFCVPTHGSAPEKANEIATTELALKALGVEPEQKFLWNLNCGEKPIIMIWCFPVGGKQATIRSAWRFSQSSL